jgi:hypothetical protein
MAKMKRYPKKPKANAALQTWQNWEKRAAVIKAHNDKIKRERDQKQKIANKFK